MLDVFMFLKLSLSLLCFVENSKRVEATGKLFYSDSGDKSWISKKIKNKRKATFIFYLLSKFQSLFCLVSYIVHKQPYIYIIYTYTL